MFGLLKLFKGNPLKEAEEQVRAIGVLESSITSLTDEELKAKSIVLRERIRGGESIDDCLMEGFALVREAARRTLGQRPYDVQLMGGIVLHRGAVAEMATGEGKTLAAVAPVYLNALIGKGVHVVTVNDYLARRDMVWMGQIYRMLGLSTACIVPNAAYLYDPLYHAPEEGGTMPAESKLLDKERDTTGSFLVQQEFLRPIARREAYLADITYGTNHEFGFDYLRDNLAYSLEAQVQREHHYAVIDEVDSVLIDEARTPLIISAPDTQSSEFYKTFARISAGLEAESDYLVDEKLRSVSINESGIEKVEKIIGVDNLYAPDHLRLVHYLEESLKAKALYKRDKDYVVKNGEVSIVDEFTGRMLAGRRYNGGLHQAIEAKEGVHVKEESRTYAKISIQNYFRLYKKISGMTGTAQTSAEEFSKVYKLEVVSIPPNRPTARKDASDKVYKVQDAKWNAVVEDVRAHYEKGQPVLLGTASIAKNELVSALLTNAGIPHEVLNAKNNEREGSIIAQGGKFKAITVATNIAGRGVDIILGGNPPVPEEAQKVRELGGLHVIGTDRHEARRIDNQLRGRTGRQGDNGSSQFYLSLEDDLLRIFGGDRLKSMMDRLHVPDDEAIEVGFLSRAIEEAQSKVEGANFDMRKHLLEYDDVLNKQRTSVYARRKEIMESLNKQTLGQLMFEAATAHLEKIVPPEDLMGQDAEEAQKAFRAILAEAELVKGDESVTKDAVEDILTKRSLEAAFDPQGIGRLLSMVDMLWMSHLDDLEALNESVGLRAYGQKDPLVEYRQEGHRLFQDFWVNFNGWVFMNIAKFAKFATQNAGNGGVQPQSASPVPAIALGGQSAVASDKVGLPAVASAKVGRNDPCPCGSGKKYKRCHGK